MPRTEQEPEVTVHTSGPREGARTYRHPAYGQIRLSKTHGDAILYGSDFRHRGYVSIEVYESEFTRDLSRDWPHAGKQLVRLSMSEAQWAAFVSSVGVGEGVQCTLERVGGEARPSIPYRDADIEHMAEARKRLENGLAQIKATRALLMGLGLSRAKLESVLAPLDKAEQEITVNFDFVAKSFAKAMETRVEKAKVEINAYMTNTVMRAGIASLNGGAMPLLYGPNETP